MVFLLPELLLRRLKPFRFQFFLQDLFLFVNLVRDFFSPLCKLLGVHFNLSIAEFHHLYVDLSIFTVLGTQWMPAVQTPLSFGANHCFITYLINIRPFYLIFYLMELLSFRQQTFRINLIIFFSFIYFFAVCSPFGEIFSTLSKTTSKFSSLLFSSSESSFLIASCSFLMAATFLVTLMY